MPPHAILQRFLYDLLKSVTGSWVHSHFNRTCSYSSACASRRILHLLCTAFLSTVVKLSHTNLSRKKKHHDLLLSSTHVAWVGSCGRGKCFFAKPGDWESLHYSGQPTAVCDSIGRQSTNAVQMVLAGFVPLFPFLCLMKCHVFFNNS